MAKTNKILTGALATLALIGALAGCATQPSSGGSQAQAPSGAGQAGSAGQEEEAKNGGVTTVVYTAWGDANEKKAMDQVAANYMKLHPEIKVDIQMFPNADYDAKITTMVASNEKMDISQLESATIAYPLAEEGRLMDLNELFATDENGITLNTYLPISYYYNNDEIIGIFTGTEIFALFYSKDSFDAAGLPYPPTNPEEAWTWDEFVEVSKKLTLDRTGKNAADPAFDPQNIGQYGINFGKWWASWGGLVASNGGEFITDDNKFGLSQPAGYEALQKIADLTNVHHVAPSATIAKGLPGAEIALSTGQYAMTVEGQWTCLNLGNEEVNFGVAVLPKMGDKLVTQAVSGMYSIWKDSEHPKEAWDFMHYAIDPSSNLLSFSNGNLMPNKVEWLTDPDLLAQWTNNAAHPEGYVEAVVGMLMNYSVTPPTGTVKNFNKIMDLVNPALDEVWLGDKTAQEAMKAIEDKVEPLIEGKRR